MHPLYLQRLATRIVPLLLCISFLFGQPNVLWAAEESSEMDSSEIDSSETDGSSDSSAAIDSNNAASATTPTAYYLPNIPKKRAKSLLHHMELMARQDEVVQLSSIANANDIDAGLAEDYYGLFLADATGSPQGGVLILHDSQQHGHWPDIVAPLREYLPQHGWTTLTIELPDIPARKRIPRQDNTVQPLSSASSGDAATSETSTASEPIATGQAGEPILTEDAIDNAGPDLQGQPADTKEDIVDEPTDESLEPSLPKLAKLPDLANTAMAESELSEELAIDPIEQYRKQNQQRIFAAMEYLRSKGQLNLVIIGYGIGAAWAIDYLAQQEDISSEEKGLTLVTIDAMPSRYSTMTMNQQLTSLRLPFLDLIQPDKTYALKLGRARQAIMNRNKNEKYQQIITSDMASYHEDENPTNRRIRGWLKSNAGGTLVKMRP